MTMKVITARDNGPEGRYYVVHLDDTKLIPNPIHPAPADGEPDTRDLVPDPVWVRDYTWGADIPLAAIRREIKLLCQEAIRQMQSPGRGTAGMKLADEGKVL